MPYLEKKFDRFLREADTDFWAYAKKTFRYQSENNPVYKQWMECAPPLWLDGEKSMFGFLPISMYQTQRISSVPELQAVKEFRSSGTTSSLRSRLELYRPDWYHQNTEVAFAQMFDTSPGDFRILALLPGYLDSPHSSLVDMVRHWMQLNPGADHGFYPSIDSSLMEAIGSPQKTLMIGVSYALIDLVERIDEPLQHTVVIETGGMKGRRAEWTKEELHTYLQSGLGTEIYSEYGMTELTSQAYMKAGHRFYPPATLRILVRDETDPCRVFSSGRGAVNIVDLANADSCAFIATDDLAELYEDGSFRLLGRLSASDIRGCSQLYLG